MKFLIIARDSRATTALVFLFFLLVMFASSGGHLDVWDGKGYFLLTENIVKHHSLILYPDLVSPDNGSNFSVKEYFIWQHALRGHPLAPNAKLEPTASNGSPLFALLGVPFYIIADAIHYSTVKFTSYFLNSLILSIMCTVVFAFGSKLYRSRGIGFVLSLVAGVGSVAWPYVSSYFEQPLSALILVSCLYFLFIASRSTSQDFHRNNASPSRLVKYSPILAGVFLGLQSFAHAGTVVVVPGLALIATYVLWKSKTQVLQFFVSLAFFVMLQLYLNVVRFGSISEFGYGVAQSYTHTSLPGLYGLLISPGYGLLVYFPLLALFPLAVYYLWRENKVFCIAFVYAFLSVWAFYGTLPHISDWTGAAWGPRYMVTIIPVMALTLGSFLSSLSSRAKFTNQNSRFVGSMGSGSISNITLPFKNALKILFITLAGAGFVANLLGVLVWFMLGTVSYGYGALQVGKLPSQLHEGHAEYFAWFPQYAPIVLHWKVLTTDWWWKVIGPSYPSFYGWKPCVPDNFLYCNFGILPLVAVIIAISSTGIIIMTILLNSRGRTDSSTDMTKERTNSKSSF